MPIASWQHCNLKIGGEIVLQQYAVIFVLHPKVVFEMVGKQRHLMRKEQFVAKACPQLKVVEEVKRPIQHLRHGIERENVREERRQHVWHFATLQELIQDRKSTRLNNSH